VKLFIIELLIISYIQESRLNNVIACRWTR